MPTEEEIAVEEAHKAAEAKAAESKEGSEHMIPKHRLDQVLSELKAEKDKRELAEKKALEFEEAEAKRRESELSEVERLKAENAREAKKREAAEERLSEERIKAAFIAEATKAQFGDSKRRFVDAEIAYKLAERSGVKIEGDKVSGVLEALTELAKGKTFLLESDDKQGDGVGTGRRGTKPTDRKEKPTYPKSRY